MHTRLEVAAAKHGPHQPRSKPLASQPQYTIGCKQQDTAHNRQELQEDTPQPMQHWSLAVSIYTMHFATH
jgi:hypothetical protein